jgi:hypothetical protein
VTSSGARENPLFFRYNRNLMFQVSQKRQQMSETNSPPTMTEQDYIAQIREESFRARPARCRRPREA